MEIYTAKRCEKFNDRMRKENVPIHSLYYSSTSVVLRSQHIVSYSKLKVNNIKLRIIFQ